MTETAALKEQIALTALNSMMSKDWFDICTVDKVAELLGISMKSTEAYAMLHPLHCVHWSKMPAEVRDAVPRLIQECLGIAPAFRFQTMQQQVIDVAPAKRGFLKLLGLQ